MAAAVAIHRGIVCAAIALVTHLKPFCSRIRLSMVPLRRRCDSAITIMNSDLHSWLPINENAQTGLKGNPFAGLD